MTDWHAFEQAYLARTERVAKRLPEKQRKRFLKQRQLALQAIRDYYCYWSPPTEAMTGAYHKRLKYYRAVLDSEPT